MRSSSSYLMLSSDPVGAPALHLKAALYFTLKDKHKMVIFVVESCWQNGMNSWSRDGWRQLRNLSKSPHCVFFIYLIYRVLRPSSLIIWMPLTSNTYSWHAPIVSPPSCVFQIPETKVSRTESERKQRRLGSQDITCITNMELINWLLECMRCAKDAL